MVSVSLKRQDLEVCLGPGIKGVVDKKAPIR